jgi:hypothetical protein
MLRTYINICSNRPKHILIKLVGVFGIVGIMLYVGYLFYDKDEIPARARKNTLSVGNGRFTDDSGFGLGCIV